MIPKRKERGLSEGYLFPSGPPSLFISSSDTKEYEQGQIRLINIIMQFLKSSSSQYGRNNDRPPDLNDKLSELFTHLVGQ